MYETNRKVVIASLILFGVIMIIFIAVPVSIHNNINNSRKALTNNTKDTYINLSVTELVNKWKNSQQWNIVNILYGIKLIKVVNDALQTTYPKNSWAPSGPINGGFQFYASPAVFPSKKVKFQYKVMFPEKFNWVKGGKLAGIWMGNIGANGGNHIADGASFRVMWRAEGALEAYVYTPTNQSPDFMNATKSISNNEYGLSVWRGSAYAIAGEWTNITITAVMNSSNGTSDGIIGLTVNNVALSFNKFNWGSNAFNIEGLMMHTFFGGSDASWATPTEQAVLFKDFVVDTSFQL
jgi:hypothetical protein